MYGREMVCQTCVERLSGQLTDLAWAHDDLEGVLGASNRTARFDPVSGSKTPPVPVRLDVADHRDTIRTVLVSWTKLVVEERGMTLWPRNNVHAIADFLISQMTWLTEHEAAGDLCHEVAHALGRARGLLAVPGPVAWVPCPDTGEEPCDGKIRVTPDTLVARCNTCGWETDDLPWLGKLLRGDEPALVTAVDACHRLLVEGHRVTPSTIRSWLKRGHVTLQDRDERGRALYDLAELRERAIARTSKRAS